MSTPRSAGLGQWSQDGDLLPEPIPTLARDPGFQPLAELLELRDWVRETACHRPDAPELYQRRRLDDRIAALRCEPIVADRSFDLVTHCPNGHVGEHWIGDARVHDGRDCIERTCRFPSCAVRWLEGR